MKASTLQTVLALIFILLGGWCMTFPSVVETLVFKPEFQHQSAISKLLMGCFGAQAVLAGIVILTSEFRPRTFLIFGLAGSIPFFIFNYYFYFVEKIFTSWMLLDFAGNIGILSIGIFGYILKKQELSI